MKADFGNELQYGTGKALAQLKDAISKINFGDVTRHRSHFEIERAFSTYVLIKSRLVSLIVTCRRRR